MNTYQNSNSRKLSRHGIKHCNIHDLVITRKSFDIFKENIRENL